MPRLTAGTSRRIPHHNEIQQAISDMQAARAFLANISPNAGLTTYCRAQSALTHVDTALSWLGVKESVDMTAGRVTVRGGDGVMARTPKMRHCFNCGEEIGAYADYDRLDTCGKQECEREARDARSIERDEAHEQLDRDMGW